MATRQEKKTSVFGETLEAYKGIRSPDRMTRRASLGLWTSTLGFILTIVLAVWVATGRIRAPKQLTTEELVAQKQHEETLRKKAEIAALKDLMVSLGDFSFQVTTPSGPVRGSIKDLGEIEVVARCSEPKVCVYITAHKVQAQHEVTAVLKPITRDELVSVDGKKRLKKKIMLRLNAWLPHGQIEDLYFAKVLVQ